VPGHRAPRLLQYLVDSNGTPPGVEADMATFWQGRELRLL
jgi:hypothetical protein